jgi:hypothetical protein|tara:strand:- start:6432 stop:6914 length:483 start_codon:yes stop_codon:yes gene_type:complete
MTTDFKSIIIAFLFFFICFAETNAVKLPEKVIVTSIDPEGCTDWTYYKGECLASSGISGQNSSAGIRQKVCVLTQTATSITVEVTIEPVNGGIDENFSYKGVALDFRGSDEFSISVSDFNKGGAIKRTITANKSDIDPAWWPQWKKRGSIPFLLASCIYK